MVSINGLFHLLIHGCIPWGENNPLIRSPLIRSLPVRDIQVPMDHPNDLFFSLVLDFHCRVLKGPGVEPRGGGVPGEP